MLRYALALVPGLILGLTGTSAMAQVIELKLGNTSAPGASQTASPWPHVVLQPDRRRVGSIRGDRAGDRAAHARQGPRKTACYRE